MWQPIQLPYIFERMIAFSVPEENDVIIVSYEGVHRLTLAPEVRVTHYPDASEGHGLVWRQGQIEFEGRTHPMLGLYGGMPLITGPNAQVLDLDAAAERLLVCDGVGDVIQEIRYRDLSGDWAQATFSRDGQWLLIGVPYNLYVYRFVHAGPHP